MLLLFIDGYLLLSLGIDWWASRRVHSSKDFVIAGRNLTIGSILLFISLCGKMLYPELQMADDMQMVLPFVVLEARFEHWCTCCHYHRYAGLVNL